MGPDCLALPDMVIDIDTIETEPPEALQPACGKLCNSGGICIQHEIKTVIIFEKKFRPLCASEHSLKFNVHIERPRLPS